MGFPIFLTVLCISLLYLFYWLSDVLDDVYGRYHWSRTPTGMVMVLTWMSVLVWTVASWFEYIKLG